MRASTSIKGLSAATALALLAACSGTSAVMQKAESPQPGANFRMGHVPAVLNQFGQVTISSRTDQRMASHYSCPATGPIKYASDSRNNIINVYVGRFAGQAPCGQITSGVVAPQGLYVKIDTHDLYVANMGGFNVLVFHRGQTTSYNTYTDPGVQFTNDVAVAKDGTIIASNQRQRKAGGELGSVSTWIGGPNGGKFVGTYPMTNDEQGGFVTVRMNGTVYYNDFDATTGHGALWSLSCPAGVCGAQTRVAGVSLRSPGGMVFDPRDDLLAVNSDLSVHKSTADTFELPNPKPKTFALVGIPFGMAINELDDHWFVADPQNNDAAEYLYPSGKLVGTVPGNLGGDLIGIAIDPGYGLK